MKIYMARKMSLVFESSLYKGASACFPPPYSRGTATGNLSPAPTSRCHSWASQVADSEPINAQAQTHFSRPSQASTVPVPGPAILLLSCPAPAVVLCCVPSRLPPPTSTPSPSHQPVHGGNGPAPPQPLGGGAHGRAAPPPPVSAAAAPAPARPPRLPGPPAAPAAPAARGLGRARDEGGRGQDGRGDHREVRPRVRPLESVHLQRGGGRRGEEEVADGPGQGAPGQVRRRVPGHLHLALARLLHPLLPPHQRRRRRAGPARQGWHRDGRDRREGGDLRAGLRRAQGRVADQVPAHGGADAGGGRLAWQDQEGRRLMRRW